MDKLLEREFNSDGRGPELHRLVWNDACRQLIGAEYTNPGEDFVRHLRFRAVQVVQLTPDEIVGMDDPNGLVDLGRSEWQASFNPHHLSKCRHVRARFYDEALDLICEGVEAGLGELPKAEHQGRPRA